MPSLSEIDDSISTALQQLRKLRRKRKAIVAARSAERRPRNVEILKLFDDEGLGFVQIANKLGLPSTLVRQFLWSRGRTVRGRQAIRSQLIISTSATPPPPTPGRNLPFAAGNPSQTETA